MVDKQFEQKKVRFDSEFFRKEGLNNLAKAFEYVEQKGTLDYIVSLGSGITSTPYLQPKNISKMNILAALVLQSLGIANEIIIAGGPTLDKEEKSEAEVINSYIQELLSSVKEEEKSKIHLEKESKTTKQNAENIKEFLDSNSKVGITGSPYHVFPRAKMLFEETLSTQGLEIAFSSYGILKDFLFFISRYIHSIKESCPIVVERLWNLTLEIRLVLHNFKNLSPLGDGGRIPQAGVAIAYMVPPVRSYLESLGSHRGIEG